MGYQGDPPSGGRDGRSFEVVLDTTEGPISVEVERKRVKNLNLRVRPDGSVHLSMPLRGTRADAEDFLARRRTWIAERVAKRREHLARLEEEPLCDGTVALWGERVSLIGALRETGLAAALSLSTPEDESELDTEAASRKTLDPLVHAELSKALYRYELECALPLVTERVEARLGVHADQWQVRHMTSRWGSCTPESRSIRISSLLAAYPPICLEFVVTHELVHLMEPTHNARFHMLLDIYCPHNRAIAARLRQPA
ncbi:M48 family metallopeptidase [Enorma phocaeensis]|uniref:SprT family zinc-dependent metalloprotease n=1 Tax=Enorma phocaeensis TaxID=1871019 RepID=A0ABT7VA29_9ACTN|nr:SprT family zinc-dependent metalloprotease [Enorma phocaeensis]MDM8275362.1 SprT family zinc-dependent metalloprotease [Enorma phocaeensis]